MKRISGTRFVYSLVEDDVHPLDVYWDGVEKLKETMERKGSMSLNRTQYLFHNSIQNS